MAASVTESSYTSVTPYRITDTRAGSGLPNAGSTLGAGGVITVQVIVTGGAGGVPAGATDASLNVTATDTTAASRVSVYASNSTRPTVARLTVVPGASGGFVTVYPTADHTPRLATDVNWAAGTGPLPKFTLADTAGTGSVGV